MTTTKSNRLNISVSRQSKLVVNRLVTETGLFKGDSDFVFSAIRSLYLELDDLFSDAFNRPRKKKITAIEEERLLVDSLAEKCNHMLDTYSLIYPGPLVAQFSIRPNNSLLFTITEMARLLFPTDSEDDRIQKVCRIAIYRYTSNFECYYKISKILVDRYDMIVKSAESELSALKQNNTGNEDQ
ncbi:MAG: hypothetical protein J5673_04535 [Candidatus Methanomethylophilaceae archaeon]|nr:hypothetical protein [Candidatus Methanomethylophilaceae archaeon]